MGLLNLLNFEFGQYEEFYSSLDKEKNSWELDLQSYPNAEAFFDARTHPHLAQYGKLLGAWDTATKKLIGLFTSSTLQNPILHLDIMFIHSYVINENYQRQGLAKQGLNYYINVINESYKATYPFIERIRHVAKIHNDNIGSIKLVESIGFNKKVPIEGTKNTQWAYVKDYFNV